MVNREMQFEYKKGNRTFFLAPIITYIITIIKRFTLLDSVDFVSS